MMLHKSTFEFLDPTTDQKAKMADCRHEFAALSAYLLAALPDGPDKTHVLRLVRTAGMWANVALTREEDGSPRP